MVRLVEEYGIKLKRHGNYWNGLCPFHREKEPSFAVYERSGKYVCFGCGAKGDSVDFLMRIEGIGYKQAFKVLREMQLGWH